jgi:hypothetical protein
MIKTVKKLNLIQMALILRKQIFTVLEELFIKFFSKIPYIRKEPCQKKEGIIFDFY